MMEFEQSSTQVERRIRETMAGHIGERCKIDVTDIPGNTSIGSTQAKTTRLVAEGELHKVYAHLLTVICSTARNAPKRTIAISYNDIVQKPSSICFDDGETALDWLDTDELSMK